MRLSRASAVATFAAVYLAENPGMPVQTGVLAEALDQSPDYLIKLLQRLVKQGVLRSTRGPAGGFELARDPAKISLLEIVEGIDGPLSGEVVTSPRSQKYEKVKSHIELTLSQLSTHARGMLGETTLRDLIA